MTLSRPSDPSASATSGPNAPTPLASPQSPAHGHDWRVGRFPPLMPRRIEDILLVSSPYDSFILEEDGLSTEMLYTEYVDLGLTHAPNITRVSTQLVEEIE